MAFALKTENGDNLPIHLSMKLFSEGYILVIDGKDYRDKAYFGDLIARQARAMGTTSMVIDGFVRSRNERSTFVGTFFVLKRRILESKDKEAPWNFPGAALNLLTNC